MIGQRVCESDGVTVDVHNATVAGGPIASCGSSESFSIAEEPTSTTSLASVIENSPTTPTVTLPDTSERSGIDTSQRAAAERSQAVTTTTVSVPPAPVAREDALYLSRFGSGASDSVMT